MMKFTLLAASLLVSIATSAQTYRYLTIKQHGSTLSIPFTDIESVTFTTDDMTTPEPGEEQVYTLRVLTFEDADYRGSANYLGKRDWTSLVDNPQYGGPMLYADYNGTPYRWYDQNNTELYAAIDPNDEGLIYWNGGEAISNYIAADYATSALDNFVQLSTPTGGHGGSANFCVHNGYFDGLFYDEPSGGLSFHDGVARVVDHMFVSLTSYSLSVGINGNRFCDPASPSDWVKLVAIGTDATGKTHSTEISMCEGGRFVTDWVKWDLSGLGEIVRLDFNILSSMSGEYGLNFPAYFAYDDIAVRFPKRN